MTLLSRLEARKNNSLRNGDKSEWQSHQEYQEAQLKKDMTRMLETIKQSSVLDSSGEYRIINFVMRAENLGVKNNIRQDLSLVTQSTIKHLVHLESILNRWHGPVGTIQHQFSSSLSFEQSLTTRHRLPNRLCWILAKRLKIRSRVFEISDNYAHGVPYPNNLLRNVGRRNALTDFIFVIDIDMVPNDNLYSDFMDFAVTNKLFIDSHKDDKTVYVVPAFEVKEGVEVPRDKNWTVAIA
ncbi:hypothetical protein CEXT_235621 [Caerostris extrusa]|uniref:Beta-1,4-glucuronyltransferase 1 n=1 Tax=Caerostris extrusa TaxID=172846 RepID=A0AAV4U688_CAEEX|nr:hypothetical protein CEXT_235621 [Caerostris extrusa]